LDWLDSAHTFSFGHYHDQRYTGFGPLRVINEDRVRGGRGFDPHSHRDMEIITYVLEGGLKHADSLGNGSTIQVGDLQRMSAGTGVTHSEYNASAAEIVHFLQIWIEPQQRGLPPSYEQRSFASPEPTAGLRLVASADGRSGSLTIHRDVELYIGRLAAGGRVTYEPKSGRRVWIQMARGAARVGGQDLGSGDGAAFESETRIELSDADNAEFLLFDLD
jgi:redox-sensitive bicupin YhaK (pirin superfamily)